VHDVQAARGASLSSSRTIAIFGTFAAAVWALDQVTKLVAVASLDRGESVTLVPHAFSFTLTRKAGAAFSTGTGFTVVLSAVAVVVCGVVIRMSARLRDPGWAAGLGLLLGGALGNLTDRMVREPGFMRGHVVDFLHLNHWPVFNVADIGLTLAAIVIIWRSWRGVGLDGTRAE
jgi:signal peptidase II